MVVVIILNCYFFNLMWPQARDYCRVISEFSRIVDAVVLRNPRYYCLMLHTAHTWTICHTCLGASLLIPAVKNLHAVQETWVWEGAGKIPWRRECNPLHYSGLRNTMDRGAWQTTVHGVTPSRAWLSHWHFSHVYREEWDTEGPARRSLRRVWVRQGGCLMQPR